MILIDCPWCGRRDEAEFSYSGDATVQRPPGDATEQEFYDYVHVRKNPRGWHVEWWHHAGGCRQFVKVVRNTMTHEVRTVVAATDRVDVPRE